MMVIYAPRPKTFICIICRETVDTSRWYDPSMPPIEPVCRSCERTWGGSDSVRNPDYRRMKQIKVLAAKIETESYQRMMRGTHV
jgi:hypothetical protein